VGEADSILTILSPENGLLQASVKGARRPGNNLAGASQIFTYGEFDIYTGRISNSVNACEIIDSFSCISMDVEKFTFAAHLCKIVRDVIQEGQRAAKTTQLLSYALYALNTGRQPNALVARCFEFRLLCLHGYMPEISVCVSCRGECTEIYSFDIGKSGIICEKCGGGKIKLLESTLQVLRYIAGAEMKKVFSFTVNDDVLKQLNEIIPPYMVKTLERDYDTLKFLEKL